MTYDTLRDQLIAARETTTRRRTARDSAAERVRLALGGADADHISRAQATLDEAQHAYEAADRHETSLQVEFNRVAGGHNPPPLTGRVHTDAATGKRYKVTTRSAKGKVVERLRVPKDMADEYLAEQDEWRERWREADVKMRGETEAPPRRRRTPQTKQQRPAPPKRTPAPTRPSQRRQAPPVAKAKAKPTRPAPQKPSRATRSRQRGAVPKGAAPAELQPMRSPCPTSGVRVRITHRGASKMLYVPSAGDVHLGPVVVHRRFRQQSLEPQSAHVTLGDEWVVTARDAGVSMKKRWATRDEAVTAVKRAHAATTVPWWDLRVEDGEWESAKSEALFEQWFAALDDAPTTKQAKAKAPKAKVKTASKGEAKQPKAKTTKPKAKTTKPKAKTASKSKTKAAKAAAASDDAMAGELKSVLTDPDVIKVLRESRRQSQREAVAA